jgi:hypothetical protein
LTGSGIQISFDKVFNELGKGISTGINALLSTMPIMHLLGKDALGAITGTSQQAINAGPQASTRHSINMMKNQFEQDVQNLRASTTTFTGAGGDLFRPARTGESSIYSLGGEKVIPILREISSKLNPTTFPAQ